MTVKRRRDRFLVGDDELELVVRNADVQEGRARVAAGEDPRAVAADIALRRTMEEEGAAPKALARKRGPETLVHHAADAHAPKLSIAFRYAFAMGRKAIAGELRAAGFNPSQERDERGQWTDGGGELWKGKPLADLTYSQFSSHYVIHYDLKPDAKSRIDSVVKGGIKHGMADTPGHPSSSWKPWIKGTGLDKKGAVAYVFHEKTQQSNSAWLRKGAKPTAVVQLQEDGQHVLDAIKGGGLLKSLGSPDQPRDEQGQWTSGGSGVGAKFVGAPVAGSKQWIKARQKDYETDREFRIVADAASLLAQGNTWAVMRGSRAAAGDPIKDEKGVRNPLKEPLGQTASPMANHKSYFKGQGEDWGKGVQGNWKDEPTLLEAGKILNKAVDEGPVLEIPMYRGLHISPYDTSGPIDSSRGPKTSKDYEYLSKLKAGDSFNVSGVQSFTTERQIAKDFSLGEARGQNNYASARRESSNYGSSRRQQAAVLIEIEKGARGLPIASLSPWKQREVLTRGKFEVVSNTKTPYGGQYSAKHDLHIVVRQRGK